MLEIEEIYDDESDLSFFHYIFQIVKKNKEFFLILK